MTIEILWRDGFDHYNNATDLATVYASVGAFNSFGAGRTNGKSVVLSNQFAATLAFQGISAVNDITLAVATFNEAGSNENGQLYQIINSISGVVLATLNLNTANLATVTLNSGAVYNGAIPLIPMLNWTHIQFRLIIGTSGSFELRLNGASTAAYTVTGINTTASSGAVTTANGVSFPLGSGGNFARNQLDDLIICTGGFIGDCRIQTDFAILDDAVQFTPLSGTSNFAMVDEVAMDSDTTYVFATAAGVQDLYGFTPLSLPAGSTVLELSLCSAVRKDDAGVRGFTHKVLQGSTTASGTAFAPSTSYEYVVDSFGANDPTGAAWTETTVNSAFYGGACSS